jgi:ketosteroid isomerase-like protein
MKRGYEAYGAGDLEAALQMFAEDCEWVDAPELPGARTWNGHEGLLKCWASWGDVWGEVRMEPSDYLEVGEGVYLVSQTMRASGAGSGAPIEMELWSVARFEDGKIRRVSFHVDEAGARKAAGLAS